MKIAKKLLAAIVAVMLVCSLAVCAFASTPESAETGAVALESDWTLNTVTNTIAVNVYFVDAVDLKSWDLIINYDPAIFSYMAALDGADAEQVANCMNNSYTKEFNNAWDADSFKFSGYFKEVLWTSEQFEADSNIFAGKTCVVNDEKFHALTIHLKLADAEKFASETTAITISASDSSMTFAAAKAVSAEVVHVVEVENPTDAPVTDAPVTDAPATDAPATDAPATDAPATDAPATDAPATDAPATRPVEDDDDDCDKPVKPNKPGRPNHNHPNTGDSAVLAAAAGVVLLAGAAFVVSKKRK